MNCPCGGSLEYRCEKWTERHGLDCGPYEHGSEEWYECRSCGEKFTDSELREMAEEEMAHAD